MAKEICISTTPHETRLAILEDDQLAEIYYERENEYTLAGSIYKGRVTRVLPGMQSSFVDVGLERDAFLYVTDFLEEQEDSEEYTSEGNGGGGRREARPQAEPSGDEPQGRSSGGERHASDRHASERNGSDRNGADRNQDRTPDRGGDRNGGERGHDRNADRGGRRPAAVAAPQPEAPRESGRASRERAREQAVAPLREAVPAAQDLDEKGDDESPEGTRRWRGRRGRRRGVRASLPKAEPQALTARAEEAPAEVSSPDEPAELPSALPEHGAPGGIAGFHAAPALHTSQEEEAAHRGDRGRDRRPRRSREPYAQASTLDRPLQDRPGPQAAQPSPEIRSDAGASRVHGGAAATGGTIVLPGESLSKYGSAPTDPAAAPVVATATVPRTVRPVNYVAPKPSTLVEPSNDWDGGTVMPGETLSRYRAPAATAASHVTSVDAPVYLVSEAVTESAASIDADPAAIPDHHESAFTESLPGEAPALSQDVRPATLDPEPGFGSAHPGHAEFEQQPADPIPFAEPEIIAAAISPEAEAGAPHVAEPVLVDAPEAFSAEPAVEPAPEPAEYEPENASASYRVQRTGPSELRLPSPELEEAPSETLNHETSEESLEPSTSIETYAEPTGEFAGALKTHEQEQEDSAHLDISSDAPSHSTGQVAEFEGELAPAPATEAQVEPSHAPEPWPSAPSSSPTLHILHDDGTVDLAAAHESSFTEPTGAEWAQTREPEQSGFDPHDLASPSFTSFSGLSPAAEAQQAEAEQAAAPRHTSEFSELVDQMQGFAPGHGLLEEETIDEEEYDFEPLHAHADDGDQEDLEEETLDQHMDPAVLSDAVRESHLEQRVHPIEPVAEAANFAMDEEEAAFGFEEVEEGEEEFEEEGDESAPGTETGEPQRAGRPDESRRRGRSSGRSTGRPGGRSGGRGRSAQTQSLPIISELLKQGQEILVQIAKEPIAKKGARITSHIALPGRFLVFMPTVSHVGVSRKIVSDEERQRLKRILISEKGESSGGFIVRTAAEGASEEDLRADLRFLISLWTEIKQRSDTAKAPALIYHDLNLIERILRDQVSSNFSTIWVDSEAEYERIIRFLNRFQPQLVRRVKLYTKETPLFEHFGIQEEISKALKSKVWLKSGGSIVINQTEALVAIDINTGKYVGKTSRLEDTIVKTNLDAIPEIVRQIRLRDLGGIIVIDFIDMDERKNRNKVLAALEEELKNDRAPSKVLQFNDFGLVAITRKRVKQSLERTLSVTCETCTGTGMVKSPITVCNEIYTEMRKMLKHLDGKDVMLRVHPEVVKQLKAGNGKWINELEEMVAKTIIIKSDPALHPEQFDIH